MTIDIEKADDPEGWAYADGGKYPCWKGKDGKWIMLKGERDKGGRFSGWEPLTDDDKQFIEKNKKEEGK